MSPGVTANRALTVAPDPPWVVARAATAATGVKAPPEPPSAAIVTKQMSGGTCAAPACAPGVLEENSWVAAGPAEAGVAARAAPPTSPTRPVNANQRLERIAHLRFATGGL